MHDKTSDTLPLQELFAALHFCVLERVRGQAFRMIAQPPEWLSRFARLTAANSRLKPGDWFPFLDSFLLEAEEFWDSKQAGVLMSGPWVEITPDQQETHLEASALRLGQRQILLLQELGQRYQERRDLLQKARENSLNYQRLFKEIQTKEVLLHCIVHDLAGPLTGVKGLFALLASEDLSQAGKRRLQIGRDAADRLENLMNTILDVFSAEVEALEAFSTDPADAPDLLACLRAVVDTLQAAATLKNIQLKLDTATGLESCKVAGETTRLERVLFNLLDNALRHSPSGGAVLISARREDARVRTSFLDEGAGIDPETAPNLFKKFHQGKSGTGKAGLGLYFCRIVVERWGGEIGYTPRQEGGSCFWFTLPAVQD